jgi:hypothetical protein
VDIGTAMWNILIGNELPNEKHIGSKSEHKKEEHDIKYVILHFILL